MLAKVRMLDGSWSKSLTKLRDVEHGGFSEGAFDGVGL
jgi:hypothetical protein